MKKLMRLTYKKAGVAGILIFLVVGYGCKESLTKVNSNHNDPKSATPTYLLTSGEEQLAIEYWGIFPLGYFGNLYAEYWSENQYSQESRYQYRQAAVVDGMFNTYYQALNTVQQIVRQNRKNPDQASKYGPSEGQIAIAQILKAWTFQTVTDIYGSVPYTHALRGADEPNPKYDSQKAIYAGLIDTLESASKALKGVSGQAITDGDVFYDGDAQQWRKFANSLIMRLAIREADAAPDDAKAAFQFAYKAGAMNSTDDNALFPFKPNPPYDNQIYDNYEIGGRDDWGMAGTLIKFMNKNNDPRRGSYAEPAINRSPTKYHGFPFGLTQSNATNYKSKQPWSRPSERVRQATAPAIFMTYSETLFDEAEAAQRGWISGSAASFYKKAIQASMDYWDVSSSDAKAYISNHPYQPGNWRQNIGRQKWVALYMQGVQGWSVYRRLDFGLLIPPVDKCIYCFDHKTKTPVRLPYPNSETQLNKAHVDSALSAQGFSKDDQGQRLWWDKAAQGK
jgi:hypothetical protein